MKIIQAAVEHRIQLTPDEHLIISQLLDNQNSTRIALAEALKVSPAWVTKTIKPLIARQVVEELGDAEKSGGRRAKRLGISSKRGAILGLAIGEKTIQLGLSNLNAWNFEFRTSQLVTHTDPHDQAGDLLLKILTFVQDCGMEKQSIQAVGLGFTDPDTATGGLAGNTGFASGPRERLLNNLIEEQFPKALILADRDVNLMALGELTYGKGRNVPHLIFLKLGNHISASIVCQGQVFRGASGTAGEISHFIVEEKGPECSCGKQGCLVALAGGRAIACQAKLLATSGASPILSEQLNQNGGHLSAVDVGDAASQGDLAAVQLVDQCGKYVGKVLADLVRFYNPDSVFIGGGVSRIGHRLLNSIRQVVLQEVNPLATRDLQIDYSQLGDQAAVMGAIKLAQGELFVESPD